MKLSISTILEILTKLQLDRDELIAEGEPPGDWLKVLAPLDWLVYWLHKDAEHEQLYSRAFAQGADSAAEIPTF